MTWQELLDTIPFRLNRDDLSADFVEQMANERISFYGPQIFVPSEQTDYSITTEPGQFFYKLPAGTQQVTWVRVLFNGVWIVVPPAQNYSDILQADPLQPPFTSLPVSMYAVYGNQIRLFPTPNLQYPVEITGMFTIAGPTDPNDETNFWVNDGRVLLINATCAEICREYLDIATPNSPRIATFDQNTANALEMLMMQVHSFKPSVMKQYL